MNNCHNCANYDRTKKDHTDVCASCRTAYVNQEREAPSNWKPIPMTNADRIRAMSDEELAQLLYCADGLGWCTNDPACVALLDMEDGVPEEKCMGCLISWLQQPAEEDAHA